MFCPVGISFSQNPISLCTPVEGSAINSSVFLYTFSLPLSINAISSPIRIASFKSCVTKSEVILNLWAMSLNNCCILWRVPASKLPNGSSNKSNAGLMMMALPKETLCLWPLKVDVAFSGHDFPILKVPASLSPYFEYVLLSVFLFVVRKQYFQIHSSEGIVNLPGRGKQYFFFSVQIADVLTIKDDFPSIRF